MSFNETLDQLIHRYANSNWNFYSSKDRVKGDNYLLVRLNHDDYRTIDDASKLSEVFITFFQQAELSEFLGKVVLIQVEETHAQTVVSQNGLDFDKTSKFIINTKAAEYHALLELFSLYWASYQNNVLGADKKWRNNTMFEIGNRGGIPAIFAKALTCFRPVVNSTGSRDTFDIFKDIFDYFDEESKQRVISGLHLYEQGIMIGDAI